MLLEVMFGRAMNRSTTKGCLIMFDYCWLGVFVLPPEQHVVTAFSNYYGRGFSPTAILLSKGTL